MAVAGTPNLTDLLKSISIPELDFTLTVFQTMPKDKTVRELIDELLELRTMMVNMTQQPEPV